MVRIVSPLFGTAATGNVGTAGTFRMSRYGPEFIAIAKGSGGDTPAQRALRACFKEAKAAHSLIEPTPWISGKKSGLARVPDWPTFWQQWLLDHPECR
jgi:hypothetical protein